MTNLCLKQQKRVKWELGLACFGAGKMGFSHWDWDSQTKKTIKKWEWDLDLNKTIEMGMGFAQNLDWGMGPPQQDSK